MSHISFIPKNRSAKRPGSFLPPKPSEQPQSGAPQKPDSAVISGGQSKSGFIPVQLKRPGTDSSKTEGPAKSGGPSADTVAKLSLESLTTTQSSAIAALPAPASAALSEVWNVLDGFAESKGQLLTLLDDGALGQSDGEFTVAERLQSLTTKQRASGFDSRTLTAQTIALLAEPESHVFQGSNTYTCGAANLQVQLAEQPSLLAKMVDELSDSGGVVKIGKDTELHRPDGVSELDKSGRSDLDRLMQGTLMGLAGKSNGRYDVLEDKFSNGDVGLRVTEIAQATATLEGQDHSVLIHDGETHQEVQRVIEALPPGESVQLGVSWNDKDHMLLLLGQKDGQGTYFDPQERATGTMPMSQLLFKTQVAILPSKYVQDVNVPEDALYNFTANE